MKKMKERSETSNWRVDHFSLIFVNLSLAWNLYFYEWLQNKGKIVSLELMFCENNQQRKAVNYFSKHSILDVWQSSAYASVICYTLFGKTEEPDSIDLVAI